MGHGMGREWGWRKGRTIFESCFRLCNLLVQYICLTYPLIFVGITYGN